MKKTILLVLIAILCLGMVSCGDNGGNITPPTTNVPDTTKVPDTMQIPDTTNASDTTENNEVPEATTSPTETAPLDTGNDTSSPADVDRRMIF